MQFLKTLLACCLLYGLLTGTVVHSSASDGSPRPLPEELSVKSTASSFLITVFREKGIDLDPRTWVVDDKDKVPKTWKISSMPQFLLSRQWVQGAEWVVALYHEETSYLKPIVRVMAKVINTSSFGSANTTYSQDDKGGLFLQSIENEVYNGNKLLKPIAMTVVHPGIQGPELRKALGESLNYTLPLHFQYQIPPSAATVPEVSQWLNLWFVENRKSSTAITKSIKRLRWDGNYLWSAEKRRMQKDLQAVGLSRAYSQAVARDIVAAKALFRNWSWFATIVITLIEPFLLAAILFTLLCLGHHQFLNQWG